MTFNVQIRIIADYRILYPAKSDSCVDWNIKNCDAVIAGLIKQLHGDNQKIFADAKTADSIAICISQHLLITLAS